MDAIIPRNTFDRLVNYLSKCPFGEVENIINELRATVQPVPFPAPGVPPKPDQPQAEGGDVSDVQSTETNTTQQTPLEQTIGEEANSQETKPSE